MTKTYYEYYCDSCNRRVETKEDLKSIQLILRDEQCRSESIRSYDTTPRIYSEYTKVFCPECYVKYRNTISNFVKEMSKFGIEEDEFYTKEQEKEDEYI